MIGATTGVPEAPPGRRELRKQTTRRGLLLAGRRLFSERGLYESRIEDVAEHARIAKGTLYLYFRDKDDLILAVVSASFEELRTFADLRQAHGVSLRRRAARLIESHLRFLALHPDQLRILHQARGLLLFRSGRWRSLLATFEAHLEWIADRLGEVPEGRGLSRIRKRAMARLLFGTLSGIVSVQAATGAPLTSLLRRPAMVPRLADLVVDAVWTVGTPRAAVRRGRRLPLRR